MASAKQRTAKFNLILMGITVVAGIVATFIFYGIASSNIRNQTLQTVNTISHTINADVIAELEKDNTNLRNNSHDELKALFEELVEINDRITFIYLMGVDSTGDMFFIVDSDTSEDQAHPGDVFEDTTSDMWRAWREGISIFDSVIASDDWGTWVSAYSPIKNHDGKVVALLGIDIAFSTYALEVAIFTSPPLVLTAFFIIIILLDLRNSKKRLQQIEQKSELLSAASHEIRSPLISIRWVLEDMLKHSENLSESDRRLIEAVYKNSNKIINNINEILQNTQVGSQKNMHEDINILEAFQNIADTLSLVAQEHQATIVIDPSVTAETIVKGNRTDLDRAFYNIVNNALKYTNPGTNVIISYSKTDQYHQIHVADHGPGVKPEDRDNIFTGLYRTEEAKASKQVGTGLGLYFVKKTIDAHHGRIYVDPNYTDGTSFIIDLPL